jgi:hypothetical protein
MMNSIIMNEIKNHLMFNLIDDQDDDMPVLFTPIQIIYQGDSDDE